MKIYAVEPDAQYRMLYPEESISRSDIWQFDARPLVEKLPKQFHAFFEKESDEPKPDIAYIGMMTFAFREAVATALADILERDAELIPFYVGKEIWYCLNVTTVADVVDTDKSVYEVDEGGVRFGLNTIAFDKAKVKSRLTGVSLFKVPEDNFTTIYCVDQRDTDEHVLYNLFCAVAAHRYTGIEFVEVYSDE